jgi:diguanylate cyclase (GGDEF)-like protein
MILVAGAVHLQITAHPHGDSVGRERDGDIAFGVGGVGWNLAHGFKRIGRQVRFLTAWSDAPISKLIRSHIVDEGVELIADEVAGMPLAAAVQLTTPEGHPESSVSTAPIARHCFSAQRIQEATSGVSAVVLDAHLSVEACFDIASRARQLRVPVFMVGAGEDKVDRFPAVARLLAGAILTTAELERLLDTLGLHDPVDVACDLEATVAVVRERRGVVLYTPDGERVSQHQATVGQVRNYLGVRDAYAVETIDALVQNGLRVETFAGPVHGLIAAVAASDSSNSSSDNALNSMIGGLQQEASHDQLTGLFRRRAFEEQFNRLRSGGDTLMVIDCDHFKRVNDTVGHDAGDQVLREVSAIIGECSRASDVACRWGGDEFVVFLTRANPDEASVVAERIRARAAATELHGVTLSIGLTAVGRGEALADVVSRADDAMYAAKHNGKNAFVWAYAPE